MNLGAGQPAIPPLGVEPLVLDEDLFLLAMSRALDNTLPSIQSKLHSVIHNVFEQFRLTTPPPARYQQRPLEQSSTPISDPKTQIEIVHSHLWKARSKQVALKSTAATGGVKKRHRSRLGTYGSLATDTHPKRKVSFQRLVAEIAQDVKVDWRSQSSVVPSLLGSTVSTQVNNTNASFCSVSNTGTLSFVNNGCGAVDSVFVGSIHVGFSVRHDNQGPNSGEKVRECHALHLFDEMLHSNELGNVGRTVPALTSIRDKGGGLAHQPLEYALGVNCAKDNEGVDMKANQLEDDNAISEIGFSSQLIQSNDLLKIVSGAEVPIDGIVITGQTHVNERLTTHEARAICERFGCRIIGGTMSDGCLQVKAIRVSKGRDQNENDVKQDLKIFQSSYFSGGTVVFSDIHELENYFQLDAYNSKSFLGLMPLKELLNKRCGSVKGEWDDLLAGGSSVTLLTKDICNVLWVSSDALKLIQYGLRTAVVFVMDKPPSIVGNSYESIANSKRVLELILEKWKSRGTAETIIGLQCCYCEVEEILLFCREAFNIIGEMTQTTTINFQDDRRDFVSFLCDMIKLYVVIFNAFIDNAGSLLHADIFKINGSTASSLVDMYAHCGVDIEETVFYLMISRGLGNMGQIISSMADSSNKNSFSVEVVRFFAWNGDPGSSHIKRVKAEMSTICVLDYENGFSATEVPQFGGIDFGQGFSSDEMHKSGFMLYGLGSMKNFATPHEVIAVSWNVNLLAAYVKSGDIYSGHQLWGDNTYVISFSNVTSWNHIFCFYFQNEINMEVKHIINSIQEVVVCWNYMIAGHSLNSQHEVITMQISYATILSCCAKLAYSSPGKHVHARLSLTKFGYVNDALVEFHDQMSPRYKSKIMKYLREHLKSSSELLLSPRVIQISLVESTYQTKLVMTLSSSLLDELYNRGIGFSHIATSMQSVSIRNGSMLVLLQLVWLMLEKLFKCEHKENVFTSFELLWTNQFIVKALGFQQKLFILIGLLVTESLPYDLIVIWGDGWFLSGKHYCFLGYVDEVNKCSFRLLDKLMAERKCDNTIDITLWKFETTKYYTDIVAPRHPDFIKDMITSTSKADNAILIIDSTTGGSEADISKDGLACEYTLFTFILGDKQMIYCCNKTSWDAILSCRWLFELQLSSRVLLLCSYDSFQISTHHGNVAATFFSFFLITCGAVFEDLCFWVLFSLDYSWLNCNVSLVIET